MKKFLKGFIYAFNGIINCIKVERNFRFHIAVMFHLFAYIHFFDITKTQLCILIMLCGIVLSLEALNTSIENAIDSTEIVNSYAGIAKDSAAGAVLISAVVSVICGIIILWQPNAFSDIFNFFIENPLAIIIQLIILIFGIWFVFVWHKDIKSNIK